MRLWQSHGQTALESCHLCVLNASALSSEILKNLVLPGVLGIADNQDWDHLLLWIIKK